MMSPTRFSQALNILGGAQFETGKHYWEVLIGPEEILQSANWIIGVSYHSIPRNAWLGAVKGSWVLHHTPKETGDHIMTRLSLKKHDQDFYPVKSS